MVFLDQVLAEVLSDESRALLNVVAEVKPQYDLRSGRDHGK